MDNISKERIAKLHPKIREDVTKALMDLDKVHIRVRITQGYRTIAEQDKLYAQSRTMPGPNVTNARGGQSWHNYGLAFDFCLMNPDGSVCFDDKSEDWAQATNIFKSHNFEWGGDWINFIDTPHFQRTYDMKIQEAYKKIEDGNVDKEGYINIRT